MADNFGKLARSFDAPFSNGFSINAAANVVLTQPTRAIWVGATGNITLVLAGDVVSNTAVTLTNVPVGMLNIRAAQIYSSTTANGIVGLY